MYPVFLNLSEVPIFLFGQGEALLKRKDQLIKAGATEFVDNIEAATIVMVAGLDYSASETIAKSARAAKKLVNVEDVPQLCDFYFGAFFKRGDITVAVSTNGASPTLARRLRDYIAEIIGSEWLERVSSIKELRDELRARGQSPREILRQSEQFIDDNQWFTTAEELNDKKSASSAASLPPSQKEKSAKENAA